MDAPLLSRWGHGQLLAFSGLDGPTSYEHGLCLRTRGPGAALEAKWPGLARIDLHPEPPVSTVLGGDHLDLVLADGSRVRGALLDAGHLLLEGPVRVETADPKLVVARHGARTLVASAALADPARIHADLDAAIADRQAWVARTVARLAVSDPTTVKALRQLKTQIYSPEGVFHHRWSTPDRWPHRGCWLWDSAFHAIGARHVEPGLARDLISAVFDGQQPDGRVPIRMDPDGTCHPEYTQPPTLALSTWACEQVAPDPDWLGGLLPRLESYLDWDRLHRNGGNGLPVWKIEGDPNCRSGESGLDNSSRFDSAHPMEAVDFSSFLSLEYDLLSRLAGQAGDPAMAGRAQEHHRRLNHLIRSRLWDATTGLFRDFDLEAQAFCPVAAVTAFLPLACGAASPEQVDRLAGHLADPKTFGTPVPLPSVARNDPTYTDDMWRGPVWINMAWMVAEGFDRSGRSEAALRIRSAMRTEIARWQQSHGTLFEFFDPMGRVSPDCLRRKGRLAPEVSFYHQCFHDYGWTGTLYLDFVLRTSESKILLQ